MYKKKHILQGLAGDPNDNKLFWINVESLILIASAEERGIELNSLPYAKALLSGVKAAFFESNEMARKVAGENSLVKFVDELTQIYIKPRGNNPDYDLINDDIRIFCQMRSKLVPIPEDKIEKLFLHADKTHKLKGEKEKKGRELAIKNLSVALGRTFSRSTYNRIRKSYNVARNSGVEKRVHEEIFGDDCDAVKVVTEKLRDLPPAPLKGTSKTRTR